MLTVVLSSDPWLSPSAKVRVMSSQTKMQAMESAFDVCTEDLFNQVTTPHLFEQDSQ